MAGAGACRKKLLGPVAIELNAFVRQALHAATLGFHHPVSGEVLQFSAELPPDMARLLHGLREAVPVICAHMHVSGPKRGLMFVAA